MTFYQDSKLYHQLKYIQENEGCEWAEAADGLNTFMEYVGFNENKLIEALIPIVQDCYEQVK